LDGPDCLRHVDSLMSIKGLQALQWTAGAGVPGGGDEMWYPLYDKVRKAGKSLWVGLSGGTMDAQCEEAAKLYRRYGPEGLYLLFGWTTEEVADEVVAKAANGFR
ncbi:MAG: trimethylamine corrinoid protein 2, partial [Oscillospiraceae bacterium]|nr:trimethylamine corrinoid protein 2 [Oscillospiraceae bacterium]